MILSDNSKILTFKKFVYSSQLFFNYILLSSNTNKTMSIMMHGSVVSERRAHK